MGITASIITGVISGILTSCLIYTFLLISQKLIIPWYQTLIYTGIDISGKWISKIKFENRSSQKLTINIDQKANKVTALVTVTRLTNIDGQEDEIKIYKYLGEIRERFVTLVGRNIDKQSLGVNSILMEVKGDGKEMEGYSLLYSTAEKKIISVGSSWTRENYKVVLAKGISKG